MQIQTEKLKQEIEKGKHWVSRMKPIIPHKRFRVITGHYHDIKDFVLDNAGFFLIKQYPETKEIGAAFVTNDKHEILFEVRGKRAQEVYHVILNELRLDIRKDHVAYLGKELKKAEYALEQNVEYLQE